MLCRRWSRGLLLRLWWGHLCLGRRRRGICGALGGMAVDSGMISLLLSISYRRNDTERGVRLARLTLNAALYGIPIGKFANIASNLFFIADLNARLCDIS